MCDDATCMSTNHVLEQVVVRFSIKKVPSLFTYTAAQYSMKQEQQQKNVPEYYCCCCSRIIKSVVTGQAPVTLELRNTPGKNTNNTRWYTHISQLTQFMPPPETYKSEIGSQSTMCHVYTWCIRIIISRA